MKRVIAFMLVLMTILSSASSLALAAETNKPIAFSGYEFGDTFKSIRSRTRMFCIDFLYGLHNKRIVSDPLDDFAERDQYIRERTTPSCFFARPSEGSRVAGHTVETELWFVYPFKDGRWVFDEDEALFYAGVYEFSPWDDVPAIHKDLKSKLATLYDAPLYSGADLNDVLGKLELSEHIIQGYNDDKAKFKPEYTVWKSSVNDVVIVLSFWRDTNVNENKLRLAYVSNYAEDHFKRMSDLGAFGASPNDVVLDGMEGL